MLGILALAAQGTDDDAKQAARLYHGLCGGLAQCRVEHLRCVGCCIVCERARSRRLLYGECAG